MCQNRDCTCNENPRIFIAEEEKTDIDSILDIQAIAPIIVSKNRIGEKSTYIVSSTIAAGGNGQDGKDGKDGENGKDGKDGVSATVRVGTVTQGINAQVTNIGSNTDAVFNFVIPKGDKGDATNGVDGKDGINGTNGKDGTNGIDGITLGLKAYALGTGNLNGSYLQMNNFAQGTYADSGNTDFKKIRIRAWVTVANMQNWTTLKLTRSSSATYNGTLISQRVKHSEATLYVGQHEISAYVETNDRYIGFTFSDTPGGNYNSDGAQYGDYGVEIFILS